VAFGILLPDFCLAFVQETKGRCVSSPLFFLLHLPPKPFIMKASHWSDALKILLVGVVSLLPEITAWSAPYAVYRLSTTSRTSENGVATVKTAQNLLVIDLDPASTEAAVMAMIVPTGAYITNKMVDYGGIETLYSGGRRFIDSALSINIQNHPILADFQATLTGRGSTAAKVLARARRGGRVTARGTTFTVAAAPALTTRAPEVFVASFSGNGNALSNLTYNGSYVALSSLTTATLRARFDSALTALANQDQGVFIPRTRSLPAAQVSSVQAAGGISPWLRQILLADGFAPANISDLDIACDDGILNGDETDIDCGGSCGGCALGQTCSVLADCAAGVCQAAVCTATSTWYRDADGDGWGNFSDSVQALFQPSGYVAQGGDCDDSDSSRNPEAIEICNTIDDNCNGIVDDGFNLFSDLSNCGACGIICPTGGECETPICSNGLCQFQSLPNGTACSVGVCQNGTCINN
jgi:hypothetical protein